MKKIIQLSKPTSLLIDLIHDFRSVLNILNHLEKQTDKTKAREEVNDYFTQSKSVFGLYENNDLIGFSVIKEDDGCFWLDWLYIRPESRGYDNASSLFDHSQDYVISKGGEKLFIWVHPENKRMLKFLSKKGYDTLNLI